jgi:NAD(P)H-binding
MAGRIVLLGATGYTGRLVAQALTDRGMRPVLAGRDPVKLAPLAERLGNLETVRVDVSDAAAVRGLVERGDVMVTTVGPFVKLGEPAVRAAAEVGAVYLDSTGEPPFIRRVFEEFGPIAAGNGGALLTAFGYDFVPGNLAGALALRAAGPEATMIEVGYFLSGARRAGMSRGTARTVAGLLGSTGFAFRGGHMREDSSGSRLGTFTVAGTRRDGISVGGSEHFTLPTFHSGLSDVDVFVGGSGVASRAVYRIARLAVPVMHIPAVVDGARRLATAVAERVSDPEPGHNDGIRTTVAARALNATRRVLAEVHLDGPEPYRLTGDLLAWGAVTAATHGVHGTGALGPVDAYGLDELTAACAEFGLHQA